jgi:di/tricarboxylate transporter
MSRFALAITCLLLCAVLSPDAASACSVCFGGAEESRKAFLFTTVLLSMLPIGMIGALAWWVWRHAQAADDSHDG